MWWAALPAAVLAGAVALLMIPVEIRCRAWTDTVAAWSVQLGWLFGLIRVRWARSSDGGAAHDTAQVPEIPSRPVPAFMTTAAGRRRMGRLLRALYGRVRLRRLDAEVCVGLDDPADTGVLMGLLLPWAVVLRPRVPGRLDVRPDFSGPRFEGHLDAQARLVPLRTLGPLLGFGLWAGWQAVGSRGRES